MTRRELKSFVIYGCNESLNRQSELLRPDQLETKLRRAASSRWRHCVRIQACAWWWALRTLASDISIGLRSHLQPVHETWQGLRLIDKHLFFKGKLTNRSSVEIG